MNDIIDFIGEYSYLTFLVLLLAIYLYYRFVIKVEINLYREEIASQKELISKLQVENTTKERQITEQKEAYERELNEKSDENLALLVAEKEDLEKKFKRSEEILWKVSIRSDKMVEKQFQRSEELLLNILPYEVAEELKHKGMAEAKAFEKVTVIFTDFKDFTAISEHLTARELVSEIDYCFKGFDEIIGRHNIEKIKTIGDSYMAVGGLPVINSTHAEDVINAALEIRDFMAAYQQKRMAENKEGFAIRIGIHTGSVVAGIVGVKKFAYDIWGDTVNIASRMESSGEAGKVNISDSTYQIVKDKFKCTYRGKIQAKNKGTVDMYFVDRLE